MVTSSPEEACSTVTLTAITHIILSPLWYSAQFAIIQLCWFVCLKPASATGLGTPWTREGTHPVHPWSLHTQHPGATQQLPKRWMEEDGWPNKTVWKVSMAPCGNHLFLPPNELQQFTKVTSNPPPGQNRGFCQKGKNSEKKVRITDSPTTYSERISECVAHT